MACIGGKGKLNVGRELHMLDSR